MNEEPKKQKIQNLEEQKNKAVTADSSTQDRQVRSAFGKSRVSTAKSSTSLYSINTGTDAKDAKSMS